MFLQRGRHGGWKGYCRLALSPGSLSLSLFFFMCLVLQWTSPSLPLCFPPPFFSWPLPQLWKWTLCYGYEGEDEVCSKFPALLARQPLGSQPTFCKSSLANQNSCRQSPDPEFPDKEMFMLSFFKRSLLPWEWGWKKLKPHTGLWGLRAGVYGYVHCIVCLITRGDSVHVWLACLQRGEYADFRYLVHESSREPSALHGLKGNRLFKRGRVSRL